MLTHKLLAFVIAFGSPFVLWLGLYLTARRSDVDVRLIAMWLGVLRWITWLVTVALLMTQFIFESFPAKYAFLSLGFSSGVMMVDLWTRKWVRRDRAAKEQAATAAQR